MRGRQDGDEVHGHRVRRHRIEEEPILVLNPATWKKTFKFGIFSQPAFHSFYRQRCKKYSKCLKEFFSTKIYRDKTTTYS
jgi:hypothetical protein